MHVHALPANFQGELGALHPRTGESAPTTEAAIMAASFEAMERNNIVIALVSGPLDIVGRWRDAAPNRILAAPMFPVFGPWPDLDDLRRDYERNALQAMFQMVEG